MEKGDEPYRTHLNKSRGKDEHQPKDQRLVEMSDRKITGKLSNHLTFPGSPTRCGSTAALLLPCETPLLLPSPLRHATSGNTPV
jgi:hypothetical protein